MLATTIAGANHFPSHLHRLLSQAEAHDVDNTKVAISWKEHGRCFMIHNQDYFEKRVLPRWFPRLKFPSFQRQLHKHGFRRLHGQGPDKGAYFHEQFQRGRADLTSTIQPIKGGGKRGRKLQATEPKFHDMAQASSDDLDETTTTVVRSSPRQSPSLPTIIEAPTTSSSGTRATALTEQPFMESILYGSWQPASGNNAAMNAELQTNTEPLPFPPSTSQGSDYSRGRSLLSSSNSNVASNYHSRGFLLQGVDAGAKKPAAEPSAARRPATAAGTPTLQEDQLQHQIQRHSRELQVQLQIQQQLEDQLQQQIENRKTRSQLDQHLDYGAWTRLKKEDDGDEDDDAWVE